MTGTAVTGTAMTVPGTVVVKLGVRIPLSGSTATRTTLRCVTSRSVGSAPPSAISTNGSPA